MLTDQQKMEYAALAVVLAGAWYWLNRKVPEAAPAPTVTESAAQSSLPQVGGFTSGPAPVINLGGFGWGDFNAGDSDGAGYPYTDYTGLIDDIAGGLGDLIKSASTNPNEFPLFGYAAGGGDVVQRPTTPDEKLDEKPLRSLPTIQEYSKAADPLTLQRGEGQEMALVYDPKYGNYVKVPANSAENIQHQLTMANYAYKVGIDNAKKSRTAVW